MESNDCPKFQRRSIRLQGYDYHLPGAYFLTLVAHERRPLFGRICQGKVEFSIAGQILQRAWFEIPHHYPNISLDAFCVMPNHMHGIIQIKEKALVGLPELVRWFKSFSARRINAKLGMSGKPVWQRNYYEHIIRSQTEWEKIHMYILCNPEQWDQDPENNGL